MRTITAILCIVTAAVLAVCLTFERHASAKLCADNNALLWQLRQMDMLLAENQRLSNLVATVHTSTNRANEPSATVSSVDDPAKELVRLRAEVQTLRQQSKEIETLRA